MYELRDDFLLLDKMMMDSRKQKPIYLPGVFWEQSAQSTARRLKKYGICDFRASKKVVPGASFTDAINFDPIWSYHRKFLGPIIDSIADSKIFNIFRKVFLDKYLNEIKRQNSQFQYSRNQFLREKHSTWFREVINNYNIPESLVGGCKDIIDICGKKMAFSYFAVICRIFNFYEVFDFKKINSMMIIGGGFGYEAHIFQSLFPNIKNCINIDIPPNLYIATQYLKALIGENVIDYGATAECKPLVIADSSQQRVFTLTPWQIEDLEVEIDLLWNSCSFQEMTTDIVTNYAYYIEKMLRRSTNPTINLVMYDGENSLPKAEILKIFNNFNFREIKEKIKFHLEDGYPDEKYYFGT